MHLHEWDGKEDLLALGKGIIDIKYRLYFADNNRINVVIEVKTSEALRESIDVLRKILK